jgi:formate hydrogenlyase subunit 3/multisubunit Na+/H+ antiporter MnhD subunit
MSNPILLVAIGLGGAFSLGIIKKLGKEISFAFTLLILGAMAFISMQWLMGFLNTGLQPQTFTTAGGKAPFVIVFHMGLHEAMFTFLINLMGFVGAFYLHDRFKVHGYASMAVFIIAIMGMNGVVLTGDIFNLFVFLEIATIATAGLVLLTSDFKAISAGFKYMIASGLISGFLLLGIIFLYKFSGSLNINDLIAARPGMVKGGGVAVFLVMMALLLELKPFPANGWGIDLYEGAPAGVAALISVASTTAVYYVLLKLLPMGGPLWFKAVAVVGMITFVGSNFVGLSQTNVKRILGYSSIGQIGLLMIVAGLSPILGGQSELIIFSLLVTHYLAKAGLFWLAGIVNRDDFKEWGGLRKSPLMFVLFGVFIFALLGFPPFPSFFGKWQLVMGLISSKLYWWAGGILIATMFEGIYLFRWFSYALKLENEDLEKPAFSLYKAFPPLFFALLLFPLGFYTSTYITGIGVWRFVPLLFILFLGLVDFLPAWVKNIFSLAGVSVYGWFLWPSIEGNLFKLVFAGIFLGGAILALFAGFYRRGKHLGFYPMTMTMFLGLAILIDSTNLMEIFYGWELMTIGSFFLLIRAKRSLPHGYNYMLFSLGGSLAMMFGFGLAYASAGTIDLSALNNISVLPALAYSLMLMGFMTKTASLGFHLWLPGAHGEAVADVHFMASAILLKAGVFGIILVLMGMGTEHQYAKNILLALGWIGAITALVGNIAAAFQESAKYLLAWSSIGQLGYIIFGLATMTHLGWLAAYGYTITHFLYKGILFLVIGGIAFRVGTADMYKMGGLIKRMPFSFVAVLVAIITLSGIPPLVGFTGKWLFYQTILSKHLFYQGIVVMIAGIVAFLYLYRLIHVIFLGQLKDKHRHVKEISIWFLIPTYIMLAGIMILSMLPNTLLEPLGNMLKTAFPDGALVWKGSAASSAYGYFNAQVIMYVVGAVFATIFLWLFLANRKAQKVKQFNIFYSGEAPSRPELTHFGYNFFAHYKKAVGFMAMPLITKFWNGVGQGLHALADYGRIFHNGNGQSYLYHIVGFVVVFYLLTMGGIS